MQQRGIQGSQEELSLVWQRCSGHVFALVLCSALRQLSDHPLSHLLHAPEYKPMWGGDVTLNLITAVHYFLTPTQNAILHALSLFHEPASKEGIFMTIADDTMSNQRKRGDSNAVVIFENELNRLVQLGLISPIAQSLQPDGPPDYTLHPLLRQHILEHLYWMKTARTTTRGAHPHGPKTRRTHNKYKMTRASSVKKRSPLVTSRSTQSLS